MKRQTDCNKIASELLQVAKQMTAAMPYGRDAGQVKRYVRSVLAKFKWADFSISESRDSSGFNVYGWREMEQLPDIDTTGGRENSHAQREFDEEAKKIKAEMERAIKPTPEEVSVSIRIHRDRDVNKARLYAWLKYEEGHYVTPIEFL